MSSSPNHEKAGPAAKTGGETNASPRKSKPVRRFPEIPLSDGIPMAAFDGNELYYRRDAYFQAKLMSADRMLYEEEDLYLVMFQLNFMSSFSPQYRFRGADIEIAVRKNFEKPSDSKEPSDSKPSIRKIIPTALGIEVSERKVEETNEVTAGAGASAGPGQLNASTKQTHQDTTNFKGRRKFHGLIKGDNTACWRLYEEKGSQSGIPAIFRVATLVRCPKGPFQVRLQVSTRMVKWPKLFGLHKLYFNSSFRAATSSTSIQTIPQLAVPIDSLKLYGKAEELFLDDRDIFVGDEAIGEFNTRLTGATGLSEDERKMLEDFFEDFKKERVDKGATDDRVTVLEKLHEYLASHDESNKVMDRLYELMGLSAPVPDPEVPEKGAVSSTTEPAALGKRVQIRPPIGISYDLRTSAPPPTKKSDSTTSSKSSLESFQ